MISLRPVLWRARAYQGSVLGADYPAPEVSEISGETVLSPRCSDGDTLNERVISHVRDEIEARLTAGRTNAIGTAASLKPFMTVEIQTLGPSGRETGNAWEQVGRLDLITNGVVVDAGIWVVGVPERLLPTVEVRDGETVWTIFVRLLEQPAPQSGRE